MLEAEKIVEMFRRDLESKKQKLEELKNHSSKNNSASHYGQIHQIATIVEYLENNFQLLETIKQMKAEGFEFA